MKAKDTLYHEKGCFVCAECECDLSEVPVYAKDAQLYCEKHYKEKFVPKCARCMEYITEVSSALQECAYCMYCATEKQPMTRIRCFASDLFQNN